MRIQHNLPFPSMGEGSGMGVLGATARQMALEADRLPGDPVSLGASTPTPDLSPIEGRGARG